MRSLTFATALLLTTAVSPAFANTDICDFQSRAASKVMEARQAGVPLRRVFQLNADSGVEPVLKDMMDAFAVKAYDSPRYHSEAAQLRAVTEFGNEVMLVCLQVVP